LNLLQWMGGRVVEGTGLENRQTRKRLEGSNPSPSAIATRPRELRHLYGCELVCFPHGFEK
jgi:hypothetical protein